MQAISRIALAALDDAEVAIVRIGLDGGLGYMNRAAQRLGGSQPPATSLGELFTHPDDVQAFATLLQDGPEGSRTWQSLVHRPGTARGAAPIPVRIYAFPDLDADGRPCGIVALLEDRREEEARDAINRALAVSADKDELLGAVAGQVRTLVPFDEFHVTMIGRNRLRMRELYAHGARRAFRELVRWWTMPSFIRATMPYRLPELCRVDTMLADPRYARLARTDPDTAAFFDLGVREFLSLPIRHENQVVAFVALYAHADGTYTDEHLAQLQKLPLAEAVMAALHRDHDQRRQVILDLLQRLGQRAVHIEKVAHEMATDLLEHFEWEEWQHVSVFQYDAQADRMCLVCQANRDRLELPEHFSMPATIHDSGPGRRRFNGPLAEAALGERIVNRQDDRRGSPLAALPGFDAHGSQLAMPILGEGMRWVLYIESRAMNAFAEEEIELLQPLTDRAGALLAHSALFEVQSAVLGAISDAVIETGADGHVRWCNAAARTLLGVDPPASPTRVTDLAADADAATALRDPDDFYHREVSLLRADGPALTVLLSASTPEHLDGRVYVASDFTYQKEVQRLEELKEVFAQAALEGRVPLALASAWLEQLMSGEHGNTGDIDKILRQLARADLPLERLLRLSEPPPDVSDPPVCDLASALEATLAELPSSLRDGIEAGAAPTSMLVSAEFNDIQFCIESMISFGLRTRPESKRLQVAIRLEQPLAVLRVEGDWVPNSRKDVALVEVERWRRKTVFDLTLGASVIRRIARRAGGNFTHSLKEGLTLDMALPVRPKSEALP